MLLLHDEILIQLQQSPLVTRIEQHPYPPAGEGELDAGARRLGIELPADLAAFYRHSNGLDASWCIAPDGKLAGQFLICPLAQLRIVEVESQKISMESKYRFLVIARDTYGSVLLSLDDRIGIGMIWYTPASTALSGLQLSQLSEVCDSFSSYYRLMSLHHGVICWQYAFIRELGLPIPTRLLLARFCPDRLALDLALHHQLVDPDNADALQPVRFAQGLLRKLG
ncbi:hypothetical protein GMRT_12327 [Giardia muris]|uniref:Knr4/Smi1-like domain-containing protein n=1 Tax=Giardia muris TaxID=5742 RepID=A0A4Z1T5G7_GIAMU|nr:hypothetical protein GMRT_12327 [Giardia muris]|eukprot:TNJ28367.1 hypothetical protein GMRT_12327 [Giardia muris]